MNRVLPALALLAVALAPIADAAPPSREDGVATFNKKGGSPKRGPDNEGNWRFADPTSALRLGDKQKGVTQGRLTMDGPQFLPWVESEMGGDSLFHGNWREMEASLFAFDAKTVDFAPDPFCRPEFLEGPDGLQMSIELRNDGGTPDDESDDCGVITLLGNPPGVGEDWVHYSLDVPFMSDTMPADWRQSDAGGGCGSLTDDEAWNLVIENVSQVRICWEQCDYFRIQCNWALEIDNILTDASRN